MSTSLLLLLDLILGGAAAAAWVGACILLLRPPSRRSGWLGAALVAAAVASCLGQAAAASVLGVRAWELAQEKLLFAVPLQLVAAAIAVWLALPPLLAVARGRTRTPSSGAATALVAAASSSVVALLARALVGYPLPPVAGVALLAVAAVATWLAHAILARRGRRQVAGAALLLAVVAGGSIGYAWLSDIAVPLALAGHAQTTAARPGAATTSVTELRTPHDAAGALRHFDLTARHETVTSAGGRQVDAESFGSLPGPELRVGQRDLVEVTLTNRDIAEGVSIHWHGVDVPNGEDGVAGATQAAVLPGESFTYRFVAAEVGTYWYHTHQGSAEGIRRGLFGVLVVLPPGGVAESLDLAVPLHTFGPAVWLRDSDVSTTRAVAVGDSVRLRLLNTDQLPRRFRLTGAAFRVVAADGRDLVGPGDVAGEALEVPAGGRLDVSFTVPTHGAALTSDAAPRLILGFAPQGADPGVLRADVSAGVLDLLTYGSHGIVSTPTPTREATMVLDRLPRFFHGAPFNAYTVNGDVFPHIANIEVDIGDVVRLTVVNRGSEPHPMHIHGHHVLVLARNGQQAAGAPLWLDTFDVQPGDVWTVLLKADNPGIWLDHCHNLDHAEQGMMMALTYRGVTTPFDHAHLSG